jgi:iron complex transport system ATP-binding protein
VLNVGDTDYQLARSLDMEIIAEAPFSHISDAVHIRNVQQIQGADVVILARVPIGVGNLKNMLAAQAALEAGVQVMVLGDFDGMDYTGGEATKIFNDMKSSGAMVAKDESEALSIISRE